MVTWSLDAISETLNGPLPIIVFALLAQTSALVGSVEGKVPPAALSTTSLRSGTATHRVTTHLKYAAGCWSLITKVLASGAERSSPDRKLPRALALDTSPWMQ